MVKTTIDDVTLTRLGFRDYPDCGARPHVIRAWEHRRAIVNFEFKFPVWDLDYYFSSGMEVSVKGPTPCTLTREANTAHLYPPGRTFGEDTPPSLLMHDSYVLFDHGEAAGMDRFVSNKFGFARFRDPHGLLGRRMLHMVRTAQMQGEAGYWQIQSLFMDVVDLMQMANPVEEGLYEIATDQRPTTIDPLVLAADSFMQDNLDKPIGLNEIARSLGVSVSSLSHRYRAAMGEAPMKALTRLRIRRAAMLTAEGHGLKSVAQMTGFGSASHLCRVFKAILGRTPTSSARR